MKIVRLMLSIFVLGWSGPIVLVAQVPADLQQAMRERDRAVTQADATVWDRLTANDFTVVLEDGRMLTKAQRLAELRQERPQASPPPQQQVQTKLYGDVAVRRFRIGNVWVLDVWNKQAPGWRVVSVQVTTAAR
jgi:hypothetical protein